MKSLSQIGKKRIGVEKIKMMRFRKGGEKKKNRFDMEKEGIRGNEEV